MQSLLEILSIFLYYTLLVNVPLLLLVISIYKIFPPRKKVNDKYAKEEKNKK